MTVRSRPTNHRGDTSDRVAPAPDPSSTLSVDDLVRLLKRKLHGVSREQLADEHRTYEKRKAAIEARKQRG